MSRRAVNLVIMFFTISLTGFLVTQFFWIRGSFRAADETFRQMNASAFSSVMQQAGKIINPYNLKNLGERIHYDNSIVLDSILSSCTFDALMLHEFSHYKVHDEFEFGIIDHLTGKLHFSSADESRTNLILQSPYTRNLRNILDSERYSIVVWFPHERMIMLRKQNNWLLLLSVLLFFGIVAGYFISVSKLLYQKKMALIQRDFINNTTHEFKTPLATISIAAEMIMNHRKNMPESQVERYAAIIFEENKRIQHQVDQILQVSLLEEDSHTFNKKPLDLQRIIERCAEIGRLMLRETGGSIEIKGRCDKPVVADQVHITNVINNLIENGIKYSKDDPKLSIEIKPEERGISLVFEDHGIGIAPDQVSLIFDRMYRVPSGDLYHTPGAGLGLYYVKKVIEAHEGSIKVNSKPGEGSRFELYLPYNQDESN